MAVHAIGDVQGCARTLDRLLARLRPGASDRFVFVGDLVNRGPRSAEVLRRVRGLGASAESVLGNHDLHALALHAGVGAPKKRDSMEDLFTAPDRGELFEWLRRRPLMTEIALPRGPHVVVHAGIPPRWSVDEASAFAREAEAALRGEGWREVVRAYSEGETAAPEKLRGARRAAAVCVALTTLRTLAPDGTPDAAFKGAPEDAPPGRTPWFLAPGRRSADRTIVFGHWAALGLRILPGIVATDSGCVWGKSLSAVRLDDLAVTSEPFAD